jgi:hypothetical protein
MLFLLIVLLDAQAALLVILAQVNATVLWRVAKGSIWRPWVNRVLVMLVRQDFTICRMV